MLKHSCAFILCAMFTFSCSHPQNHSLPASETSTLKKIENTSEILPSWSKENTVVCQVTSEPENLHPSNGNSSPRQEIFQYIHRTLLYIDFSAQKVAPGLVKSLPEVSSDKLTYTYSLRDNIYWDDKKKLTAGDVIFTGKVFKCPLTNDLQVRSYWDNVKDIILYKDDPMKFSLVMKKVNFQNVSFLTAFPVLEEFYHDKGHVLSRYSFDQFDDTAFQASSKPDLKNWSDEYNSDKFGRDPQFINGLGMYQLIKWDQGQSMILKKKIGHWTEHSTDYHESAFPDQIIFKLNKDETSQSLQLQSQTVDATTNLSVNNFIILNADSYFQKNYNSSMMLTYSYSYLCFNEKPDASGREHLFDENKVRRAIAYLTPVDEIIKLQYKHFSNQCRRMISQVSPLKKEFDQALTPIPFDILKATELLTEAGWSDSDNDGILDKIQNGKKIKLKADLNYISSSSEWKDIALLIKESLAKAGIDINPVGMDFKLFLEKAKAHDFDLILGSWGGSGLDEDYTQLWHSSSWTGHGSNYSGFGNTVTDALIDSIKLATAETDRFRLSYSLQQKIYEDQPFVFLYSTLRRNVIHKRFGNQMIFSEKPGILYSLLQLLSINNGITMNDGTTP